MQRNVTKMNKTDRVRYTVTYLTSCQNVNRIGQPFLRTQDIGA